MESESKGPKGEGRHGRWDVKGGYNRHTILHLPSVISAISLAFRRALIKLTNSLA